MRIAYVLTQDLESPSGLGRYLPLARQLARRGHQVSISALHPDYGRLTARHQTIDGVSVSYVAPMHVQKEGSQKHYYSPLKLLAVTLRATLNLSVDTWRSDGQIIHVGKPHPMNGIAGLLGRMRSPHSFCVDCDDYEAGSMHFSAAWQKRLIEQFEQRIPRYATLVTVNTQFMQHKLKEWGVPDERILYLPNGVDADRFNKPDPEQTGNLRQALGLEGKRVVAYIGSLSLPSHPVDLLLRAFSIVGATRPDTSLLIVGGGGDYQTLNQMAAQLGLGDSVVFTGRVTPQEVPMYYRIADVTIDPVYDNDAARGRSPIKLFESWASGIPFITSPVGDRINLLASSKAGILTTDCTPESYARAIADVLSNVSLAEVLSTNGIRAVQPYVWEKLVLRLEQSYLSLLSGRKN